MPQIFDLITFASQEVQTGSSTIPPEFLQPNTIDTSIGIGDRADDRRTWELWLGGLQATTASKRSADNRFRVVAFKTAKIQFIPYGESGSTDDTELESTMTETFDIAHKSLLDPGNTVNMLKLGWKGDSYQSQCYLPTIVLDNADCGSLDTLLSRVNLSSRQRLNICMDVGAGLELLHRCGLAHGDVKAENVLIFLGPENTYLAKVSKIGFSNFAAGATSLVTLNGTKLWEAPEASQPVVRSQIHLTDVYSYGLLVWRLAADGANPLSVILGSDLPSEELHKEAERLKHEDSLVSSSRLSRWYLLFLQQGWQDARYSRQTQCIRAGLESESFPSDAEALSFFDAEKKHRRVSSLTSVLDPVERETDMRQFAELVAWDLARDLFYDRLDAVLESCLGKDPTSRSLSGAIEALAGRNRSGIM